MEYQQDGKLVREGWYTREEAFAFWQHFLETPGHVNPTICKGKTMRKANLILIAEEVAAIPDEVWRAAARALRDVAQADMGIPITAADAPLVVEGKPS